MNEDSLSQLYLKDTACQNLMQRRIFNVLLIASPYDAFMMEEDGRVEEQLYFEYVVFFPQCIDYTSLFLIFLFFYFAL